MKYVAVINTARWKAGEEVTGASPEQLRLLSEKGLIREVKTVAPEELKTDVSPKPKRKRKSKTNAE